MKRAEYVAVVTRTYRKALDGRPVTQQDLQDLEQIFSRQGFTDGYYEGQTGPQMFGTHVDGGEQRKLLQAARATYETGEVQRVPVKFYALIQKDQPAMLAAEDEEGNLCKAAGETPAAAMHHPLSQQELEDRLSKTGGTPYYCVACKSVMDPGLMLPAAAINALRRDVLTQLTAVRGRAPVAKIGACSAVAPVSGPSGRPGSDGIGPQNKPGDAGAVACGTEGFVHPLKRAGGAPGGCLAVSGRGGVIGSAAPGHLGS